MPYQNLLQNRINELNSAILNFSGDRVYINGFYNAKMLLLHLEDGRNNFNSKGIYDKEDSTFDNILNNALFIIQKDGIEQQRLQYKQVFESEMKLKSQNKKQMISVRKDNFSDRFLLHTEKKVTSFESKDELNLFLLEQFETNLQF